MTTIYHYFLGFLLGLSILVLFSACHEAGDRVQALHTVDNPELAIHSHRIKLQKKGTKRLPLDVHSSVTYNTVQYLRAKDREYLYLLDWLNASILVYDLALEELVKKIQLASESPNGVGVLGIENSSIHVLEEDVILLENRSTSKIYQLNSLGEVTSAVDLLPTDASVPFSSLTNRSVRISDRVIYPARISLHDKQLSDQDALVYFDIDDFERGRFFKYPEQLDGLPFGLHNYFYEAQICTYGDEGLLISFPGLSTIYQYDMSDGSLTEVSAAHSELGEPERYPQPVVDVHEGFASHNDYFKQTDRYGALLRIDTGVYVRRIIDAPTREQYADGARSFKRSLMILDSELRVVGELTYHRDYSGPNGHLLSFTDGQGQLFLFNSKAYKEDEDYLVFDIWEVKKTVGF